MNIGDKIPEILGIDQDGREIKASDYQGRKIVLYSYPKANTSGCTAEACSLQAHKEELAAAGYDIIGVSKDKQTLQKKFADTQGQQGQADPAEEIRRHSGSARTSRPCRRNSPTLRDCSSRSSPTPRQHSCSNLVAGAKK